MRRGFLLLYDRGQNEAPVRKPIAYLVLEASMNVGISDVTLVLGPRGLALVPDCFAVDRSFLESAVITPNCWPSPRTSTSRGANFRSGMRYQRIPGPRGRGSPGQGPRHRPRVADPRKSRLMEGGYGAWWGLDLDHIEEKPAHCRSH